MYIFINNTPGYDFFGVLKKKAKEGIDVKIIIDSFGSKELDQKTIYKTFLYTSFFVYPLFIQVLKYIIKTSRYGISAYR